MLYDRPVRELMREAASDLPSPTTPAVISDWFTRNYPLVKKTTVAAHIKGLTANDRNRHHYSVSRYEPVFLWRDGLLAAYDPAIQGIFTEVASPSQRLDYWWKALIPSMRNSPSQGCSTR